MFTPSGLRHCFLLGCGVFVAASWCPARVSAQPAAEADALEWVTPAAQQAIDEGLEYLASHQHADGSFGSGSYRGNVAVTALAGMAFLSGGSTPGRGKYGDHLERAIQYLLDQTSPAGFISNPAAASHGPMYGHGFAALFLAEVYGMTMRPEIREKLTKAVNLIVQTQNAQGGWRYQPVRRDADLSVTVCQIMALRAARNAGIFVPKDTVDLTVQYVKRSQNPDGGFRYMIQGGQSAMPRSAAGIVALYSAGIYEGAPIEKGLRYLLQHLPRGNSPRRASHYFYGHYYAAQAMWQAGGQYWEQWYPAIREELLRLRRADGSWLYPDSVCPEYGTGMACIVLQIPNNYLPIFQR